MLRMQESSMLVTAGSLMAKDALAATTSPATGWVASAAPILA